MIDELLGEDAARGVARAQKQNVVSRFARHRALHYRPSQMTAMLQRDALSAVRTTKEKVHKTAIDRSRAAPMLGASQGA
jgi:hypothetical protein